MQNHKRNCNSCKHDILNSCNELNNNEEYQEIIKDNSLFNEKEMDFKDDYICNDYSSVYIEYPLTINQINVDNKKISLRKSSIGKFVKIRICKEGYDEKTHLGLFLGELPISNSISYNSEKKELDVKFHSNPAIFVFDFNEIIYGCESWWGIINDIKELEDITDIDIDNVWYVKVLKSFKSEE